MDTGNNEHVTKLQEAYQLGKNLANGDKTAIEQFQQLFVCFDEGSHKEFMRGLACQAVTNHGDPVPPWLTRENKQ